MEDAESQFLAEDHDASRFPLALLAVLGFVSCAAIAQTTIATGSIVGTVTNASDAVVRDAKVTITGPTGQTVLTTTNEQGKYSAGLLTPGLYSVRVEVKGSKTTRLAVHVRVGNSANGNVKLQVGPEAVVLDEQASEFQVNTQQPTVQGVLTATQFEQLPLNGRNFLDLAQLEPGVQFQDGEIFDPSKVGYASVSFVGRLGRTARIEVDGADISDETVGTITTNIPASGIQEFQIAQASMDLSTELTSSGSINVITKSGGRGIHGEAFGQFRDNSRGAAALPGEYRCRSSGASMGAMSAGRFSRINYSSLRTASGPSRMPKRQWRSRLLFKPTRGVSAIPSARTT